MLPIILHVNFWQNSQNVASKYTFSYILLEDNNYMAPVQQDLFTQYPYYIYNIPVIYYFLK